MACPQPHPDAPTLDRPPARGWYWNCNHLARAWLPLIGPEGLGLLDFYLATADHRPGAAAPGWTAITLDELARLTGWGRARLVRLNRLLVAAGLLAVRHVPVAGHGPAVQRALYHVQRQAAPPTAATLTTLAALAERDPILAARLRRYTLANSGPGGARPARDHAGRCAPVEVSAMGSAGDPVPVPARNRSVDMRETETHTTTTTRATGGVTMDIPAPPVSLQVGTEPAIPDTAMPFTPPTGEADAADAWPAASARALELWQAANGRPASMLERERLTQLAEGAARSSGADNAAGWSRIEAAIVEAVDAGSAYVAPRRVARILERWHAEVALSPTRRPDDTPHRVSPTKAITQPDAARSGSHASVAVAEGHRAVMSTDSVQSSGAAPGQECASIEAAIAWTPPLAIDGLPVSPSAVLRAALVAAGLPAEPYLRGAALAGWMPSAESGTPAVLLVATSAPVPPGSVARLEPRLSKGLRAVLGRPVLGRLVAASTLARAARAEQVVVGGVG